MMRAILIGDSIMGGAADGEGGLGRALASYLPGLGVQIVEARGVGGSTVANWLHASGLTGPGKGYVLGRWGDKSRMPALSPSERAAANLPRLAKIPADLWWVNFGHNDFASGRPAEMWFDQAIRLLEVIPSSARVIWTEGNDAAGEDDARRKRGLRLLRERAERRWPGRVLVLDTAPPRNRPYLGRGVHPPKSAHEAYLALVRPEVAAHLRGVPALRRGVLTQGLGALAAGLLVWAGGEALLDWWRDRK